MKRKTSFKNPRWVYEGEKLRVHIAALGDVGATTLMGLKLLGSDVIETIGIIDLDENRMKRYEAECNQICYPWAYDVLPKVVLLKEDELFDCDVFIFCATKGVPPVGTAVQDVRMQQLRANRSIVEIYAKKRGLVDMTDFLPWFQTRLNHCATRRGRYQTAMNPVHLMITDCI